MKTFTQQNDYKVTPEEKEILVDNITALLDEYGYDSESSALETIVDEWADQKAELISAFKKHPNYIDGKFMIVFDTNFERTFDKKAISKFGKWVTDICHEFKNSIPDSIQARKEFSALHLPVDLFDFFDQLDTYVTDRTLSQELTKRLEKIIPEIRPHVGEKTSRVINKICTCLGFNKHPDYNREYAKFADGLNPLTIKRHTILSLNPLDYLTMSFGNSWASCHTIDKNNKRGMPSHYSGCYSSGTISYMLDGSSMVFYTVDATYNDNDYWTQPKINRQMFHWGEEKLVQGRLYPQDNDGNNDAYAPYRNIVQQIMSTVFDFPNLWTLSRGTSAAQKYIISEGTHYRDYNHFEYCTLSKKSGSENEECFTVGHAPICVECGSLHDVEDNINCCHSRYVCNGCGARLSDEDDVYWVDDEPYCRECVAYCERCGRYELNNAVTYIESEDRYVCSHCLDNHYSYCDRCCEYYSSDEVHYVKSEDRYVCNDCLDYYDYHRCDECYEYFPENNMTWVESVGEYVCNECLEKYYTNCDECGEYFPIGDMKCDDDGKALCEDCYNDKDDEDEEEC